MQSWQAIHFQNLLILENKTWGSKAIATWHSHSTICDPPKGQRPLVMELSSLTHHWPAAGVKGRPTDGASWRWCSAMWVRGLMEEAQAKEGGGNVSWHDAVCCRSLHLHTTPMQHCLCHGLPVADYNKMPPAPQLQGSTLSGVSTF